MLLKKILRIFSEFDKTELKRFEKFIRHGYFNTNERIYRLFKLIKKYYPEFNNINLSDEELFKKIYLPGRRSKQKTFNDRTLKYLLSELLHLTEKFLVISNIESDAEEMNKRLVESLIIKKLFPHALSCLKTYDKNFDSKSGINAQEIMKRYEKSTAWHQLFFYSGNQDPLLYKRIEMGENLALYAIIEICHTFQNIMILKAKFNEKLDDNIFYAFIENLNYKEMFKYLNKMELSFKGNRSKIEVIKSFKIYLCFMITFLDSKDEYYFLEMKELLAKYNGIFSRDELQNLYVMMLNCCETKRKIINDYKYLRYSFEIRKSFLELKLYSASYEGEYLQVSSFIRILRTALELKEFQWTGDFIKGYINELPPEHRDDIFHYSNAELYFQNKQFEEALSQLSKIKSFKYLPLKTKARSLTLMIYYELKLFEQAFSLMDAYKHFLMHNKILTAQQKEEESNFLLQTKTLLNINERRIERAKLIKFKNKLINKNSLSRKEWLIEKVNEFL